MESEEQPDEEYGGVQCVLCDNTAASPEEHEQHMQELHDNEPNDETCPACGEEYDHMVTEFHMDKVQIRSDAVACRVNRHIPSTRGTEVYVHVRQ